MMTNEINLEACNAWRMQQLAFPFFSISTACHETKPNVCGLHLSSWI